MCFPAFYLVLKIAERLLIKNQQEQVHHNIPNILGTDQIQTSHNTAFVVELKEQLIQHIDHNTKNENSILNQYINSIATNLPEHLF